MGVYPGMLELAEEEDDEEEEVRVEGEEDAGEGEGEGEGEEEEEGVAMSPFSILCKYFMRTSPWHGSGWHQHPRVCGREREN